MKRYNVYIPMTAVVCVSVKQKIKIHDIARIRLQNSGQCSNKSWGDKGCPCPFWTPLQTKSCEKHGLFF